MVCKKDYVYGLYTCFFSPTEDTENLSDVELEDMRAGDQAADNMDNAPPPRSERTAEAAAEEDDSDDDIYESPVSNVK